MIPDIKQKLTEWLEVNRPAVCLEQDYFIICRSKGLMIVRAYALRVGDIRIITVPGHKLVKGLTDDEWTTFTSKVTTLRNVVQFELGIVPSNQSA